MPAARSRSFRVWRPLRASLGWVVALLVLGHVSASYAATPPAAAPTFSPAAGTYTSAQSVALSDTTSGAKIYYTTNGTTPTTGSTLYSAPIAVSAATTVKALATATGYTNSAVATAVYTITPPAAAPTFSPAAGTYTSAQSVALSDTTSGAKIYYTTNGTTPTTGSTLYASVIAVATSTTIKAIALAAGYSSSPIASANFSITPPPVAPGSIAFVGERYGGESGTWLVPSDGGAVRRLVSNVTTNGALSATDAYIDWFPDGHAIAFKGTTHACPVSRKA